MEAFETRCPKHGGLWYSCEKRLGGDCGLAQGSKHVGSVLSVDIAGRVVVAGAHVSIHAGLESTSRTLGNTTADDSGVLPDDLGVVAPGIEVGHDGLRSIGTGVELDLVVVPVVADGLSEELVDRQVLNVSGGIHGNVLAVGWELRANTDGPRV